MLTCFIKNNFHERGKSTAVYSILAVPLIYVLYSIYSFVRVFRHSQVKAGSKVKTLVIKYMIYSFLYIIFYLPPILLYFMSANQQITKGTTNSWFSFFSSLSTISINLALCVFRIIEGYVKCDWKVFLVNKSLDETIITDSEDQDEVYFDNGRLSREGKKDSVLEFSAPGSSISKRSSKRKVSYIKLISMEFVKGVSKYFNTNFILLFYLII